MLTQGVPRFISLIISIVNVVIYATVYNLSSPNSVVLHFLALPFVLFSSVGYPTYLLLYKNLRKFLKSPMLAQSILSSFIFIRLIFRSFTPRLCVLMHFGTAWIHYNFLSIYIGATSPFQSCRYPPHPIYLLLVSFILSCGVSCVRTERVCTIFRSRHICQLYIRTYLLMKSRYIYIYIYISVSKRLSTLSDT